MTAFLSDIIDALGYGVTYFPLVLGVFLSFRLQRFPDLTVNGSFSLGAVVTAKMLMWGADPVTATFAGFLAGAGAGMITGALITGLHIEKALAGILVTIALYSVNVMILGSVEYPFGDLHTLLESMHAGAEQVFGSGSTASFLGIEVFIRPLFWLLVFGMFAVALLLGIRWFFRTRLGLAMRSAGENPSAARVVGANVSAMVILTLMLSNALAALSGTLWAQNWGTVSLEDGTSAIVIGLAGVLIGDAFFGKRRFSVRLVGVLAGTLLHELIQKAIVTLFGNVQQGLKLITTAVVILAIVLPRLKTRLWSPAKVEEKK
ncbi:MAG: ABC transporter permease [Ignavibacteria bacterium]|nr:MAG: ABC transporter permease [Ignavibacteria bacterium]